MQAIILAGGRGTRLKSVVADLPKPMAPINEKPFLEYLLKYLGRQGITSVVLSVGYMPEKIINHFKSSFFGINIEYCIEANPLGTGGAIMEAFQKVQGGRAFVLNGDTFFKCSLDTMLQGHTSSGALVSLALKYLDNCHRYGRVETDNENRVTGFLEKEENTPGNINGGIYLIEKSVLPAYKAGYAFSFESELLPALVEAEPVYGFSFDEYFIDIGIPSDYARAQFQLPRQLN